jgi:hypothetical protein
MRDAWNKVAAQGDAIWEQAIQWLAHDYQVQRPPALKWMKVIYGDLPFERQLPELQVPADIRPLIKPVQIRVRRGVPESVIVAVYFRCAWTSELVSVLIRDGQIHALLPTMEGLGSLNQSAGEWLDHPEGPIIVPAAHPAKLLGSRARCLRAEGLYAQRRSAVGCSGSRISPLPRA